VLGAIISKIRFAKFVLQRLRQRAAIKNTVLNAEKIRKRCAGNMPRQNGGLKYTLVSMIRRQSVYVKSAAESFYQFTRKNFAALRVKSNIG